MSDQAVSHVIDRILLHEGGITDLGDGKGVTRFGQTPGWLEDWGFVPPASAADAAANYAEWMSRVGLDRVCYRDEDLGYALTDWAVHSGHRIAIAALQQLLGVTRDGRIGPVTLAAIDDAPRRTLLQGLIAARIRFTGHLLADAIVDRRRWASGWLNRLADQVARL